MNGICFPELPDILPKCQRKVSLKPDQEGRYELGPFLDNATGIGDLLMITPVAKALRDKATVVLGRSLTSKACLFHGVCPIRFSSDYPIFPFRCTDELISLQLLKMFRLEHLDPIPRIEVPDELLTEARDLLEPYDNPIAFCPTSSRASSHSRQRPPSFWQAVLPELRKRYTILQFGFEDYPLLPGAVRFPFVALDALCAVYKLIGRYIGAHTGDHHLMIAVGGRAVVAEPDPMPDTGHDIHWNYRTIPKRIQYGKLSHPSTVINAVHKLGL